MKTDKHIDAKDPADQSVDQRVAKALPFVFTGIDSNRKNCKKYFINLRKGTIKKIIEDLYDGLYLVDRNRVITYWDKAAGRNRVTSG